MARGKHSSIVFHMDAWAAEVASMPRLMRAIYFDVCFYNWEHAAPMPINAQRMVFSDIPQVETENIIAVLIDAEKLEEDAEGIYARRAIEVGEKALDLHRRKSGGGVRGALATNSMRVKEPVSPVVNAVESDAGLSQESRQDSRQQSSPLGFPDKEIPPDPLKKLTYPTPHLVETASLSLSSEPDDGEIATDLPAEEIEEIEAEEVAEQPTVADAEPTLAIIPAEKLKPEPVKREKTPAEVMDIWNQMAAAHGLASVKMYTEARLTKMRTRIKECGIENVIEAIGLIPKRGWCMDPANRGYVTLDWFCYPKTIPSLIEGAMYQTGSEQGSWTDA